MIARLAFALCALLAFGASAEETPVPVPDGYVLQKLNVTDGSIARPKDWFYTDHATGSGWLWAISKEDSTKAPYDTGMHIQMFVGIRKTGTTPQEFVDSAFKQLSAGNTVVSECTPTSVGQFLRRCLEVIESDPKRGNAKYHIQYSAFWPPDDKGDIAFIVTFGAPQDQWTDAQPIAKVMSNVVIMGKSIGKQKE